MATSKPILLIRPLVLSRLRWARQHVYAWLILGPLVLGMTYAIVARVSSNLPDLDLTVLQIRIAAVVFAALAAGAGLSRAAIEIYALRQPEWAFESMPLSDSQKLLLAFIRRLASNLVLVLLLALFIWISSDRAAREIVLPRLAAFALVMSTAQQMGALAWIRFQHTRSIAAAAAGLPVAAAVFLGGLLIASAFDPVAGVSTPNALIPFAVAVASLLQCAAFLIHAKWRALDFEYANRLPARSRGFALPTGLAEKRMGRMAAAQLKRDLLLTLRGFSSAVYVAAFIAVLWLVLLMVVLTGDLLPGPIRQETWLDTTWQPPVMAVKLACVLATTSVASLLPVLVAHQIPHHWLERTVGALGIDLWAAKLWYTRVISSPVPLPAWLIGLALGAVPASYSVQLLGECLLLWWLISSITGALSFEIPDRPGLAILLLATMGSGVGLLSAMFWPVGIMIHGIAMHSLTERGRARARFYLLTEED